MGVSAQSSIDIAASVAEILDVIADLDSLPSWSSAHKAAEVRETDENGRPLLVWSKIAQFGLSDEQVSRYEWTDDSVRWRLDEPSGAQKAQNASYVLTDNGDGTTRVVFEVEVEPKIKVPGLVIKKAQKMAAETATKGLKQEVERRKG